MTTSQYNDCVATYADRLYRFALRSLRESEQAKDVVQESFLRLWEHREAVESGKERAYLFTVGYRLIIDQVRARKRMSSSELPPLPSEHTPIDRQIDLQDRLHEALEQLPPQQRAVILLRDYEGYSYQEIAQICSLSEAQVKVYIFRGRTQLKKSLKELYHT